MPELPEVEITKEGISPYLVNQTISAVEIRQSRLRYPIPSDFSHFCTGKLIKSISRRAKYLIFELSEGYFVLHLGMSGHLRIVQPQKPLSKHDHFDLITSNGSILRYNDPRRFGFILPIQANWDKHPLFAHLGPEPLSTNFSSQYLFDRSRQKKQCVKTFIMNNRIVVGVGNIYATESLFLAGIHPLTVAGELTRSACDKLQISIQQILKQAIEAGGTSLKDFLNAEGKPGYFVNKLQIYGRKNQPCYRCKSLIQALVIGGRMTAFCPLCQTKTK